MKMDWKIFIEDLKVFRQMVTDWLCLVGRVVSKGLNSSDSFWKVMRVRLWVKFIRGIGIGLYWLVKVDLGWTLVLVRSGTRLKRILYDLLGLCSIVINLYILKCIEMIDVL